MAQNVGYKLDRKDIKPRSTQYLLSARAEIRINKMIEIQSLKQQKQKH